MHHLILMLWIFNLFSVVKTLSDQYKRHICSYVNVPISSVSSLHTNICLLHVEAISKTHVVSISLNQPASDMKATSENCCPQHCLMSSLKICVYNSKFMSLASSVHVYLSLPFTCSSLFYFLVITLTLLRTF